MGIIDQSPFHLDNVAMKAYKPCKNTKHCFTIDTLGAKLTIFDTYENFPSTGIYLGQL